MNKYKYIIYTLITFSIFTTGLIAALDQTDAADIDIVLSEVSQEPILPEVYTGPEEPAVDTLTSPSPTTATLAIIKPDAFPESGRIIDIIKLNHFIIRACEMKCLTTGEAEAFYAVHEGKDFFDSLISFMTSGPVMILVLEHADSTIDSVAAWRALAGATNPEKARLGSLRYMFGTDVQHNAIHGSDSADSAQQEIMLLFPYGYGSNHCQAPMQHTPEVDQQPAE